MNTSSPHDAAARARFDADMNARLWYEMRADWDAVEGRFLRIDFEYLRKQFAELNPGKPFPPYLK